MYTLYCKKYKRNKTETQTAHSFTKIINNTCHKQRTSSHIPTLIEVQSSKSSVILLYYKPDSRHDITQSGYALSHTLSCGDRYV